MTIQTFPEAKSSEALKKPFSLALNSDGSCSTGGAVLSMAPAKQARLMLAGCPVTSGAGQHLMIKHIVNECGQHRGFHS